KARIGAIVSILHDSRELNRRQALFSAEWARLGFPQGRCTGFRFRGHQPNWREKMETTMRKKILTMLVVPLIAALTAQAAAASEHHHTRAKDGAAAWEQLRNSNAYAAPSVIAVPS